MTTLKHPTQAALALPYGPLAVGMPVIANHTEQPCTKLVAVVTCYSGTGHAKLRYLSSWEPLTRKPFGDEAARMTPLSAFGFAIELDEDGKQFRCVEIPGSPHTAIYRDGRPRQWQQRGQEWWPYRAEVLKMLDRRFVI